MANIIEIVMRARDEASATLSQVAQALSKIGIALPTGPVAVFAAGLGAAGAAALTFSKIAANTGEELLKLSKKTGLSVETLSELRLVAEVNETSLEGLATGFRFLSRNILQASQGGGDAADAFQALGVDIRDAQGQTKSAEKIFNEVADAFSGLEDSTLKSGLAMRIFGRSGTELVPILSQGSAAIKAQREEAQKLGLTISTEAAIAADRFNDGLTTLWQTTKQLTIAIGNLLIPILTPLVLGLIEAAKAAREVFASFGDFFGAIKDFILAGRDFVPGMKSSAEATLELQRAGERASFSLGTLKKSEKDAEVQTKLLRDEIQKLTFSIQEARIKALGGILPPEQIAKMTADLIRAQAKIAAAKAPVQLKPLILEKAEIEAQQVLFNALADASVRAAEIASADILSIEADTFEAREAQMLSFLGTAGQVSQAEIQAQLERERLMRITHQEVLSQELLSQEADTFEAREAQMLEALRTSSEAELQARFEQMTLLNGVLRTGNLELLAQMNLDQITADEMRLEGQRQLAAAIVDIHRQANMNIAVLQAQVITTLNTGLATAFSNIITGAQTAKEAFNALGAQLVKVVVDFIAQLIIANTFGQILAQLALATTVATAGAASAAWAVPATLATIATFGAAAAQAPAAIAIALTAVAGLVTGLTTALPVIGPSAGPLQAAPIPLAHGGIVTQPTLAMIGERGPEAVVPLSEAAPLGTVHIENLNVTLPNVTTLSEFRNMPKAVLVSLFRDKFMDVFDELARRNDMISVRP